MGLGDLLSRWSKRRNEAALARAENETRMTEAERVLDREDFESRRADMQVRESARGSEAMESADDDLGAG